MLAKGKAKALMSISKVESKLTDGMVCDAFRVVQGFSPEAPCG